MCRAGGWKIQVGLVVDPSGTSVKNSQDVMSRPQVVHKVASGYLSMKEFMYVPIGSI